MNTAPFKIANTVVWKTFGINKNSYGSLVTKFKHTNIIPLQNFSYEIYLHLLFSDPFSEHVLAISMALLKYLKPAKDCLRFVILPLEDDDDDVVLQNCDGISIS